ncbi:MAG: LamG domain-containing protein, partial [Planctomycetota bacterium]
PTDAAFALGTSDFTFETWVYPTVAGNDSVIIDDRNPSGGTNGFAVSWASSNGIRVIVGAPNVWDIDQTTAAVGRNSWTHYALTRSGTTFRIFLNGALVYTSGAISGSMGTTAIYATLGAAYNGANPFTGYFSGTRLIKGTCLYTSSFALPITPPTPVTNTSLLTNFTNGAIFDNTAKNVLETVGNAQISTTQSKWGGSSMYFDGTGDWLVAPANQNAAFGTGDFTVEAWVYVTTFTTTTGFQAIFSNRNLNSTQTSFDFGIRNSDRYLYFYNRNTDTSTFSTSGLSGVNTWIHVAIARIGSTITFYINGSSAGTVSVSTNSFGTSNVIYVGANFNTTPDTFNGYIDDLRITKGFARYTGNFTPQTSQWQDQ